MRNVLITGAAGNIGSALTRSLLEVGGYRVVAADNLSTGSIKKLPPPSPLFRFIKLDVNNFNELAPLFSHYQFQYVFHFAAVVGVQRTLENPLMVLRDIDGIRNILELSKSTSVDRVFYSSSSEVYGEPVSIPQNEYSTPLNSKLPYAIVKNVGEAYFRSYEREHGLQYTVFRFFNTYGPNQSDDFVVPRFIRAALAGDPIMIYGDGSQTRTFLHVDDNVAALRACMEGNMYVNDTVNIGSDQELSILDLAIKIRSLLDSKSSIIHLPPLPEGDMSRRLPDIGRMKELLSRDLVDIDQGIVQLAKHFGWHSDARDG